jgi:CxxC-x17-CxxC domain-containing protein
MPDVELRCIQCQSNFIFSERDQEIFYQRNISPPQRCEKCRPSRKKAAMAAVNSNGTKRYEIVCDRCGKKDSVPFAPKPGRNVLCSDCHQANRSRTRLA